MNLPAPTPRFISRDAVLYEFTDADHVPITPGQPPSDDFVRRRMSDHFGTEQPEGKVPSRLERLLALAREREQFCRGSHDMFGLARCLGNQALLHKIAGRVEEARLLLGELEPLCRRIEDHEGMAFALYHQAALLAGPLNQAAAALPLAEQAQQTATQFRLIDLERLSAALVHELRSRLPGSGT